MVWPTEHDQPRGEVFCFLSVFFLSLHFSVQICNLRTPHLWQMWPLRKLRNATKQTKRKKEKKKIHRLTRPFYQCSYFVSHGHAHRIRLCAVSLSTHTSSTARVKLIVLYKVTGTIFHFLHFDAWFACASSVTKVYLSSRCFSEIGDVFLFFFFFLIVLLLFEFAIVSLPICKSLDTTLFALVM